MKKLLALLLSLILIMSMLVACDNGRDKDDDDDEETTETTEGSAVTGEFDLKGDWSTVLDYGAMIGLESEVTVRCMVTFGDDGVYYMEMNENDINDLVDTMIDYFSDVAAQEGGSFEEYIGMTEDEYRSTLTESSSSNGAYTYDGEKLTMDGMECELEIINNDKIIITELGVPMELSRTTL